MTMLYRSYDAALAARKALADAAAGHDDAAVGAQLARSASCGRASLGCEITTPEAFLADAWELWGDGRAIVSAAQRNLLWGMLLKEHPRFPSTLAAVRLFARFAAFQAGGELFERMTSATDAQRQERYGLDEAENAVFALMGAYRERLDAEGLIEAGRAAAALPAECIDGPVVIAEPLSVVPALAGLFERADARMPAAEAPVITADPAQRSLFSFPAGAAAVHRAVKQLIDEEMGDEAHIAVGAADAGSLFASLAPALLAEGRQVGLECSVPFARTALGRALEAVGDLVEGQHAPLLPASDFAHGPFSGMSAAEAQRFNGRLRGDRGLAADAIRALLAEASPSFAEAEALWCDTAFSFDDAEGSAMRRALAEAPGLASGARIAEERMFDAFLALRRSALAHGADADVMRELARGSSVPISLASTGYDASGPSVRFLDATVLGRAGAASFDAVILVGLTDQEVNAASERSTLDALGVRLGLPAYPSRAGELRAAFEGARASARSTFACVMPLRAADGEPTYPSFTLDEYASAFAAVNGQADAERDEDLFDLPRAVTEGALRPGEDELAATVGDDSSPVVGTEELSAIVRGRLGYTHLIDLLKTVIEDGETLPVLSPSAIEGYLACPYRWFATSRLRLTELDEGFSAREMGLFAHRAYAELYERLADEGIRRLDASTVSHAREMLDGIRDAILVEYEKGCDGASGGERLLAVSAQEHVEVARLREALGDALGFLAQLPGGYVAFAHETLIRAEDGVDFAGARLNGRIDRVDVAPESGRFAIVDYKGGIGGHAAGFSEDADEEGFELPAKVQALIYAVGFERLHEGMAAAAAVYASYRAEDAEGFLAGSYDPAAYDVSALSKPASAVQTSFASFLALVEERIAPCVEALKKGIIAPDPRDDAACTYCPLIECERRR